MENAFDENDLPPSSLSAGSFDGSGREYTREDETNFLLSSLSLLTRELGSLESRDLRELNISNHLFDGNILATNDLYSVSYI